MTPGVPSLKVRSPPSSRQAGPTLFAGFAALLAIALLACATDPDEEPRGGSLGPELAPTRGVILISLDTLSAAHMSTYGYAKETSPFFTELAERGALFENAIVQYPSTLVSHVSLFTGLYPPEHGVYPPENSLSPEIDTLPERFSNEGFRTAGHTEGGYVSEGFGFDRGFDEFVAQEVRGNRDVEKTLTRGLDFLRSIDPSDRFFLFLHTYSVHDPYEPPEPFRSRFWDGEAPDPEFPPNGEFLRHVNMGRLQITPESLAYFRTMYDASILYLDDILSTFMEDLESLGLTEDTTIIFTSDHGEEFLQHGKMAHEQVYPETLHVPLLILHPGIPAGLRVPDLVQTVDLAPTLYELAGVSPPEHLSGRTLVPLLRGESAPEASYAYAETLDQDHQYAWLEMRDDSIYQFVTTLPVSEGDGTWVGRSVSFDSTQHAVEVEVVSFHQQREITVSVDGQETGRLTAPTGRWTKIPMQGAGEAAKHRFQLATEGCDTPASVGLGPDYRCLSFKIRGAPLRRNELFDLGADPTAEIDLSAEDRETMRHFARRLSERSWDLLAKPADTDLPAETTETLKALGYIE